MTAIEIDVAQRGFQQNEANLIETAAKKRPGNDSIESLPGV